MILIDTSIWIEYFRDRSSPFVPLVQSLIAADEAAYNGIILAELLQGCQNNREKQRISSSFKILHYSEFDFSTWETSGHLSQKMRGKGYNLPLLDCLIAANALKHHFAVFTLDKHFEFIAQFFPLRLFGAK